MILAFIGVILSLIFLITFAYRGHSVIAVAPLAALIAVVFSGAPILASYTQVFMPGLANFLAQFFPLFITGAIFGHLMSSSGFAQSIATWLSALLGKKRAIFITVLATALLTYGGVSAWVVVFAVFPIATALFAEADIPRRLMPAAIALGIFTFATASLPGSPQLHNTIPTGYFGTNTFAAPILGIIGGTVVFGLGVWYLNWRRKKLQEAGESYADPTEVERASSGPDKPLRPRSKTRISHESTHSAEAASRDEEPSIAQREFPESAQTKTAPKNVTRDGLLGVSPVIIVVAINAAMTYAILPAINTEYLASAQYGETSVSALTGLWSATTALVAGIVYVFLLKFRMVKDLVKGISTGARNAVIPAFTTASEVGYGAVIASLAVFVVISEGFFAVSENALITSVLATSGIAAVTGSASGGLTISLETFGGQLATIAADQGISMELMHRATAISATGLDSLPHNGAIITLLLVTGLTHRESYKDIGVVTLIIPVVSLLIVATLGLTFGTF